MSEKERGERERRRMSVHVGWPRNKYSDEDSTEDSTQVSSQHRSGSATGSDSVIPGIATRDICSVTYDMPDD